MNNPREINALLRLLEDPDQTVYLSVSERILGYGNAILPNLESSWQGCDDPLAMVRIETIIRQLYFKEVHTQFDDWFHTKKPELLQGCLLLGRFFQQNPDEDGFRKLIKSMHQSSWLELNDYLTPLEQVNVINSVFLFGRCGFLPRCRAFGWALEKSFLGLIIFTCVCLSFSRSPKCGSWDYKCDLHGGRLLVVIP